MPKQENLISGFDITISSDKIKTYTEVIEIFQRHCTKWCFQQEKGHDTGYIHWQCRVNLKIRIRPTTKKFPFCGHFTPTCSKTFITEDDFYVMKEDTRIDGPWRSDTYVAETRQLKEFKEMTLRGYQQEILNWVNKPDNRIIDVIYDKIGNLGKSLFCEYLEYIGAAEEVPSYRSMEDIMAWVASRPIRKMYCFDMPRGMKKDKLAEFYSGIEIIKNGVAFDKRYSASKLRFDRPRVVIFTNTLPNFELMSADRWKVHEVTKLYNLKPYEDPGIEPVQTYIDGSKGILGATL